MCFIVTKVKKTFENDEKTMLTYFLDTKIGTINKTLFIYMSTTPKGVYKNLIHKTNFFF